MMGRSSLAQGYCLGENAVGTSVASAYVGGLILPTWDDESQAKLMSSNTPNCVESGRVECCRTVGLSWVGRVSTM